MSFPLLIYVKFPSVTGEGMSRIILRGVMLGPETAIMGCVEERDLPD